MKVDGVLLEIKREYKRAREMFPSFHSGHEAYAVILEELEEFWAEAKKEAGAAPSNLWPFRRMMRRELIQVAAMAVAAILETCDD
jgi:hypothetical protein